MGSSAEAVYACLAACLAADPSVQRPAEAQLRAWEGLPGFCTALAVRARGRGAPGEGVRALTRSLAARRMSLRRVTAWTPPCASSRRWR